MNPTISQLFDLEFYDAAFVHDPRHSQVGVGEDVVNPVRSSSVHHVELGISIKLSRMVLIHASDIGRGPLFVHANLGKG